MSKFQDANEALDDLQAIAERTYAAARRFAREFEENGFHAHHASGEQGGPAWLLAEAVAWYRDAHGRVRATLGMEAE